MTMRAVLLVATLLAGGCSGPSERDVSATSKTPAAMTNTDPSDPKAWAEAQAIAAAQGVGDVSKRSAALPFMFQADRVLRAVLIHKGSVVKTRGPATAGAYLRDLGIAQGKGPQLDDVLWAIWALEALPDVKPLPPESYVNNTTSPRLADLTARIEYDGTSAKVVLHYLKPDTSEPPGAPGRTGSATAGSELKGAVMPKTRPVVRATLEIPATGDAAWRKDDLNWADPG